MTADDASQLVELARRRFESRGGISPAEEKLFRAAANGEIADYRTGNAEADDPAKADHWGDDRKLRADRIAWLCTDREAVKRVSHRGVRLAGARIEGELDLDHARIPFPLWIMEGSFAAAIGLRSAHVRVIVLAGTHTRGIRADGLKVEGGVFLRNGFRGKGEVRLLGASIGGSLDCHGGQFTNQDGNALHADGLKAEGSVFLCNGFRAEGEVRLLGASIRGDLDCVGGQFINPHREGDKQERPALNADGLKVEGAVFFREGFQAEGTVSLKACAFRRHLQWRGVKDPEKTILDLRSTRVGTLYDEEASWPKAGSLFLHGLEYDEIYHEAPTNASSRLDWLRRQPQEKGRFFPQPYEQLAKVLGEQGHEEDARQVLIGKNEDQARYEEMPGINRFGHWVLGKTIAYGYRPWRAFYLSLIVMAIGLGVFSFAARKGLMRPTAEKASAVEAFNAAMYSIDVFLPIVDFHQEGAWRPDTARFWGIAVRYYLWLHITLGWVLTTLWVAGLSGLVKR